MPRDRRVTARQPHLGVPLSLRNLNFPAAPPGKLAQAAQEFARFHVRDLGRQSGLEIGQKCPIFLAAQMTIPMLFAYPYQLTAEPEGGFTVTFPDVPEAVTQGETEAEAAAMAEDALITALSFYTDDAKPLPPPSAARGRRVAYVPPLVVAKLILHDTMLAVGVSNVDLARKLGVDEKVVRRLRDPLYSSRIDRVDRALRCLGKRIEVNVRDLARSEHGAPASASGVSDHAGNII